MANGYTNDLPSLFSAPGLAGINYCGPTSIAAIAGISVTEAEDLILEYRAKHGTPPKCAVSRKDAARGVRVKGTYHWEQVAVLDKLGFEAHYTTPAKHRTKSGNWVLPTMKQWEATAQRGVCLLFVRGHVMAANVRGPAFGTEFCDSWRRDPVYFKDAPKLRRRVQDAIYFTRKFAQAA